MSHHTTFGLVVWQRPHRVAGAPELESSTSLKVLTLKVHRRASRFVQHVVAEYGVTTAYGAMRAAAERISANVGHTKSSMGAS